MENNYNNENIDAYLANQMGVDERAAFEDQIAADSNLEQEVKKYALEREAVKMLLQEEYRQKVKGWLKTETIEKTDASVKTTTSPTDIPQEDTPVIKLEPQSKDTARVVPLRGLRRILSIAASVLVLVLAGTYYFASSNYSSQAIIDTNYLVADSPGDRSGDTAGSAAFVAALQTYFAEDYQGALTQFAKITEGEQDYIAAQYYLAHAALNLQDYTTSLNVFDRLLANEALPSFINKDKVRYNRLLAMMGAGKTGIDFQTDLQNLVDNGQVPFQQKAKMLQVKTTSIWFKLLQ